MLDLTIEEAAIRFDRITAALAANQTAITVGLTELTAEDTLESFISRADAAMYAQRHDQSDNETFVPSQRD